MLETDGWNLRPPQLPGGQDASVTGNNFRIRVNEYGYIKAKSFDAPCNLRNLLAGVKSRILRIKF